MAATWRSGFVLVAALAGVAAGAAAPEEAGVPLRFAWPDRLEGRRVEREEGRASAEAGRRSALRVERKGDEVWLSATPAEGEEEPAVAEGREAPEPPVVAGRDGRFLRLDGIEALAAHEATFQVTIAATREEADAARREAREDAARLAAEAREQWSYQVEAWLGRTLAIGKTERTTARIPVAAVPGLEVEQRVTLSARRWVSCMPGGIDRRCLELTLRADAGPAEFRKGLAAAGGKAAKGFEDGALVVDVVLVTDPETLLPWRYSLTKKLKLVFAGRDLSVDQVERRERTYQWWKG